MFTELLCLSCQCSYFNSGITQGRKVSVLYYACDFVDFCFGTHSCNHVALLNYTVPFHLGWCYFPSAETENRSNCTLFSVRADGKQHAYIHYFASLRTEGKCNHMLFSVPMDGKTIWLHSRYFPSVALSSEY